MVLNEQERRLFFPLVNGVIDRAGVMLIERGEVNMPETPEDEQSATLDILERLWSDPAVLDAVIVGWPELDAGQREVVESWHHAHRSRFIVTIRGTQAYFLGDDRAFAVSGLEKPIESMLRETPAFVETTLLPFHDKIVYDTMLFEYPVAAMPNMKKIIEEDLDRLTSEGKLLRSGDELIAQEPQIKAGIAERENERVIREAEEAMRGDEVPEGFHAGELAGLSAEERSNALLQDDEREVIRRVLAEVEFDDLRATAIRGKPKHALSDLLMFENKETLTRYAKAMGLTGYSRLRKQELVDYMTSSLDDCCEVFNGMLRTLSPEQIETLHDIVDAGGTLLLDRRHLDPSRRLPERRPFLCYPFDYDGKVTLVVPDEVVACSDRINWEEAKAYSRDRRQALNFTEALVNLRGAVCIVDIAREYQQRYPEGLNIVDFVMLVMRTLESGGTNCELVIPSDDLEGLEESYLVDYDLATIYREQSGIDSAEPIITGDVEETYLGEILFEREKVEPRPLMKGVETPLDLEDWILALPAVNALTRYLDGHVPDGQQDLVFTEDTMPELVAYMQMGFRDARTVNGYLDILEDHGFVPTESMLNRLIELLMNAANAVPQWPNNGWSANELRDREAAKSGSGHTVFYDEDGRPMKIGRNDPCPCGSGKKYKNCHGKRS